MLIHGGYMDRRMWDDQFHAFAKHHHVIRYDVRGFGRSELPPMPYADRQDLHDLLKYLGVEKMYLLGLSLGGVIAIDFTAEGIIESIASVIIQHIKYPLVQYW